MSQIVIPLPVYKLSQEDLWDLQLQLIKQKRHDTAKALTNRWIEEATKVVAP